MLEHCFGPLQFHPELNPIERCWGKAKQYARAHCDYSFPSLLGIASDAVASVSLDLMRKYFRKVRDYHRAYIEGKDVLEAQTLVKKYKSHRRLPASENQSTIMRNFIDYTLYDIPLNIHHLCTSVLYCSIIRAWGGRGRGEEGGDYTCR